MRLFLLGLLTCTAAAQPIPSLESLPLHPRIFFLANPAHAKHPSVATLRSRCGLGTNPTGTHTTEYNALRSAAASATTPERVAAAGFAYLMSGEAQFVTSAMNYLSVPGRTLSDARSIIFVALFYDWAYYGLTVEQRTLVANLLYAGINSLLQRYPRSVFSFYHNLQRWGTESAAIITAIATAGDHDQAPAVFNEAWPALMSGLGVLDHAGLDGAWPEGNDYDRHSPAMHGIRALLAIRGALGFDYLANSQFFRNKLLHQVYTLVPNRRARTNQGDNTFPEIIDRDREMALHLAGEFPSPLAEWWIRNVRPAALAGFEWMDIAYRDKAIVPAGPDNLPTGRIFRGAGYATLRSGWGVNDTLIGFGASSWFTGHQHLDQNAFTIFRSVPLAIDSGFWTDNSGHGHHYNYTMRTVAHNTITVRDPGERFNGPDVLREPIQNDGGQKVQWWRPNAEGGTSAMNPKNVSEWYAGPRYEPEEPWNIARLIAFDTRAEFDYVAGDAARAYARNKVPAFTRQIVLVKPNWALVFDRVETSNPAFATSFLLHSQADITSNQPWVATGIPNHFITAGDLLTITQQNFSLPAWAGPTAGQLNARVLLPAAAARRVEKIGGTGSEFETDGVQQPIPAGITPTAGQIGGRYRVEITDTASSRTHLFLHAMYVSDVLSGAPPEAVIANQNENIVEVSLEGGKYLVQFNKTGAVGGSVTLTTGGARTIPLKAGIATGSEPALTAAGVVNGATFTGGAIAPGEILSLFGERLGAPTAQAQAIPLPAEISGTTITVGGIPAPLYYVSDIQVNLQVPVELPAPGTTLIAVTRTAPNGEKLTNDWLPVAVAAAAPGFFKAGANSAILRGDNYALVSPANPATAGTVVVAFLSGLGATTPAVFSGRAGPTNPVATTVHTPAVEVGGIAANVQFSGLAPGFVGLYQVNFAIPPGVTPGDNVPVKLTIAGVETTGSLVVR